MNRRQRQLFRLINQAREERGKPRLKWSDPIVHPAHHHSRRMASKGSVFHSKNLTDYFDGLDWALGGENVGATYGSMDRLFRSFMRSKTHRQNILRSKFTHASVGVARASDGSRYVTVLFYG